MKTLYKKELSYYLNNPIGYIIVILFAVFSNFFFIKDIFVVGSASMEPFFLLIPWFLLIFAPALSMRIISEEKRTNTLEVLLTLPVSEMQVVMSKFLALLTVSFIGMVLTLLLPIVLSFVSSLYLPEIIVGYIGILLYIALSISISIFFSSLTKNQVVAFLLSIVTLFFLLVLSGDFLGSVFPKFIQDALNFFSPLQQLSNFARGVVDIRSLFYFVSFTAMFLMLTVIKLEKRE